jgi:hypothetical protein
MAFDYRTTIRDPIASHVLAAGIYDTFDGHPPDVVPNSGIHGIQEFGGMKRARGRGGSGLASTSMLVIVTVSTFLAIEQEPADDVDPQVVDAANALFSSFLGDFTLGGNVRCIDVGASQGVEMSVDPAYATVGGVKVRAAVLSVPIIMNDLYAEAP